MPIKLVRQYLNQWSNAGRHIHHADGDFFQATGLYPTLDRQELRRAPAPSAHLTHAGLDTVEGMFFDAANARYVLIGQDASDQLACTYFTSAWAHIAATYTLDIAVATMDGRSMCNFIFAFGYLWISANQETQNTDNYVTTALSAWDSSNDVIMLAQVGGRLYGYRENGIIERETTDAVSWETHWDLPNPITGLFMAGLKDDLLIVATLENGEIHVFRTLAYAKTANRKLEDMAVLTGDTLNYASSGCPFCIHDNDLYMLSGDMETPGATVTRDLMAYTGYRIERIARIDDATASPLATGLLTWRGELIYYELTATSATFKMLVGNSLIDFVDIASYLATGMTPVAASLGGEIVVPGLVSTDEGIYHFGGSILDDGSVETAYLDGGLPGVKKRLIDITLHVKNASATTVKTISYKKDTETSYTQIVTETDATPLAISRDLGLEFYHIRFKVDIADSVTTQDVRIEGLSYTYAVGDE